MNRKSHDSQQSAEIRAKDVAVQDRTTIASSEDRIFQEMLGRYDAPAYVRRALRVQRAYDDLLAMCQREREQMLAMVRVRLATVHALTGDWSALAPFLVDAGQYQVLAQMHQDLAPELLGPLEPTSSPRRLRLALRELWISIERFNQRWRMFLAEVSLETVNDERAGYNKYYLLEKECAVRSAVLARLGFRPLEPLTIAELTELLPELSVPRLSG